MEDLHKYLEGRIKSYFAKRVGCSISHLSQILKGVRRPSFDLMCRIEEETGGAVPVTAWKPAGAAGIPQGALHG